MAENPRIEELRRRVLADPASIAFAALAEEFRRVGRYDEAVDTCRTGLQRHPAYLSARVTLGRALIETGDYAGAREQLETVLRSAPENLAAIRGLAQIDEHLGHSTAMDPQIADMMNVMHEESLRAAAERVAVVSDPAPVEPAPAAKAEPPPVAVPLAPQSIREPPPGLSLAPEPGQPSSMADEPGPAVAPEAPVDVFARFAPASSPRRPAQDLTFDLSSAFSVPRKADPPAETAIRLSTAAPGVEPELEPAIDGGPDPKVLATLARLERFLGAIQSLRA